jgi:hypothetical protein
LNATSFVGDSTEVVSRRLVAFSPWSLLDVISSDDMTTHTGVGNVDLWWFLVKVQAGASTSSKEMEAASSAIGLHRRPDERRTAAVTILIVHSTVCNVAL